MITLTEADVEQAALEWLAGLGWQTAHGSDIAPERWTAVGYATSTDGVTWEKPRLGLHEFRGCRDNNIVVMGYGPVIKDAAEPDPARRYKMILRGPRPRTDGAVATAAGPGRGVRLNYSPDGIHWTEGPGLRQPDWRDRSLAYGDPGALIRDDQEPDHGKRVAGELVPRPGSWQEPAGHVRPSIRMRGFT